MKNKNLLIGAGAIALAIYLFKKDSSGMSVYGKLFPREKKCLKYADIRCKKAPCNPMCVEYEK